MKKTTLSILFLCTFTLSFSQGLDNLRVKRISLDSDTLMIDSLSIIPGSFKAFILKPWVKLSDPKRRIPEMPPLVKIPDSLYTINYFTPDFMPTQALREITDSLQIRYRVYRFNWTKQYYHKKPGYNNIDPVITPLIYPGGEKKEQAYFNNSSLTTTGNLARGIQIGSTQNASLNSNLNLQLHGKINDKFNIEAQLSDSNIPVQPEGNTQQIQDFDRFFIRIYDPRNQILAGDFSLNSPPGYFIRMNKNLQGIQLNSKWKPKNARVNNFQTRVTAAVSKGKYYRMKIAGIEGNQGPYRLQGKNGERYIQIIAGSEQVWIDGKLLERGEEADYTINYNTSEIRFTTRVLITKDKRITVGFEYTERSYARFMTETSNQWSFNKGHVYFNLFAEQDAKNQPILQETNDAQRSLMAQIGDDLNKAIINNYYETTFANDRVLYKKTDTLVDGIQYNILVYSTNPDSAKYQAGFSFVGENSGNYIPVNSGANGQVYEWISPLDGSQRGSYEPVTRLVTPQSKQLMSLGGELELDNRMKLSAELALSNNDLNTFSSLDRDDNTGTGLQARIDRFDPFGADSAWSISSFISYRRSGKHFNPLEKYRKVEFERDWNLKDGIIKESENYFSAGITLNNRDSLSAMYSFDHLSYSEEYRASRHNSTGSINQKGIILQWSASYLDSKDNFRSTVFARHNISLSKKWNKIALSVSENHEGNSWNENDSNNLQEGSFAFQEWLLEMKNSQSNGMPWFVKITNRSDYLPDSVKLVLDNRAWQAETGFNWLGKKKQLTRLSANWRSLSRFDNQLTDQKEQTLSVRAEERFSLLKGGIISRSFYEIGSGLERKQEFSYLEVPAGQGYYTWEDYNGNGIKELDEFEAAVFADQANYIRIFRPGNQYIPVYSNRFTQTINITPARILKQDQRLFNLFARFNNQFALSINRKTFRNDLLRYLNPFILNDSLQVSLQAQIRNTLSYNSKNNRIGADYFFQKTDNQIMMSYGSDMRNNMSHSLVIRFKPIDQIWINNKTEQADRSYKSAFFSNRNYQLHIWHNEAGFTFEPGSHTRMNIKWNWSNEKNLSGPETLTENRLELGGNIQMPGKGLIHLDLQYIKLDYTGNPNTPVSYAMLKGFRPGNNGMANLSIRRQINELIQLDIAYSGRLSEGSNIVHTGTVSVKAIF